MSHDTTIKSVPIWDIPALKSAVSDLRAKGVNCELRENSKARMWNGRPLAAHHVLHLPECLFDVAFVRETPDGPLMPVLDLHGDHVMSQIGWADYKPASSLSREEKMAETKAAHIGQLIQSYSNHATINAVVGAGHTIIEQSVDESGELLLTYI